MKGTMTNTRKGTSRKRSAQVLSNCTEKSTADITIQPDTHKKKKCVPKKCGNRVVKILSLQQAS